MQPSDVARKLLECFRSIERIAARSGLSILKLEGAVRNAVTPSDVYDMATPLVSELAYLWSHAEDAVSPHPAYFPGRKLPSRVGDSTGPEYGGHVKPTPSGMASGNLPD